MFFQIIDYPEIYRLCKVEDQKPLAIFKVDTGPYSRPQSVYRKRTAAVKHKVEFLLVKERLQLLVRISIKIASVPKMKPDSIRNNNDNA